MKNVTKIVKALAVRSRKVDSSFSIYDIPATRFDFVTVEGMTSFLTKEGAEVELRPAGDAFVTVVGKFKNATTVTMIAR